ncbi:acetyl-CoA carboxylase biotin carboxylase subunit [Nonomuraea sp. NPDC050404]|uniref:acetyl-CoA carboxylase biotin carboxylase subunit n=1 Tax=Nonomuraea sp. NPDC050404 TaxID=3155783 RepID=UPI0033C99CE2
MIGTVLIANRGEIALRVARTCRRLGLRTIAVHSTADRGAAVAELADETVCIGPPPAKASYLNIPAIIEAAHRTGADAIHPGYGFLSENAEFAEVCEEEGIVFVGPPAGLMRSLGDKATARELMSAQGLPLLPGSTSAVETVAGATELAGRIGYPLIVKAVAGGGGRGMRIVREAADLETAYRETRAAAQAVFGDGRVYIERYLDSARHVEIQVLADGHGDAVHLGARDCSVQRRHQKLIEETPVPGVDPAVVSAMGEAAVRAALGVGYVGAGTFEFLLDAATGGYYFMEVNCRLQVEHPVTEMVTGLDLVAEQLRIAAGERLGYGQADVAPRGCAIECRINAEDPERGFTPTPGRIVEFSAPGGPFVRVDTHVHSEYRVPAAYDSLLAKVVVWAEDRPAAIGRMGTALAETVVRGPGMATTAAFLGRVLDEPAFATATHDTSLVGRLV